MYINCPIYILINYEIVQNIILYIYMEDVILDDIYISSFFKKILFSYGNDD